MLLCDAAMSYIRHHISHSHTAGGLRFTKTPNTGTQRLSKRLVQQIASNNTIIVAFANAHHIDYTFNWLSYIYALNISNYLIGALDSTTAEALLEYGVKHFAMYGGYSKSMAELPSG